MVRQFPFYKQLDEMDCGPCCLRMVAKYYGKNVGQAVVGRMCEANKQGVNMLALTEAADALGFHAYALKVNVNELPGVEILPAIIHWNQNHFVVLYKIKKNRFFVADPAIGKIWLTEEEFKKHWLGLGNIEFSKGFLLTMFPSARFTRANYSDPEFVSDGGEKKLPFYLKPHKRGAIFLMLTLLLASLFQYFLPGITRSIVDNGINSKNLNLLLILLVGQFSLLFGRTIIEIIKNFLVLRIGALISRSILSDFLFKLIALPLNFFETQTKGSIIQRMRDHSRIEAFVSESFFSILFSVITFIVFSFILASYSILIFSIFIISNVIYSVWVVSFLRRKKILDYTRFDLETQEQNLTMQILDGINEIKLFGLEIHLQTTWMALQKLLYEFKKSVFRVNQLQQIGAFFINEGKNIILIYFAASMVVNGEISLGTMMAIQIIIGQLNSPIEQFLSFFRNWQGAQISMKRLNEIHSLKNESIANATDVMFDKKTLTMITGGHGILQTDEYQGIIDGNPQVGKFPGSCISINNVSFAYPGVGNDKVFDNLTFEIPLGKTTAVVGLSGSGKTTLLKLLLKYYEPQAGGICIGNIPLPQLNHKDWRKLCGTVMQDNYIFPDTIAKNISLGDEFATLGNVKKAAHLSCIDDFIDSLPMSYDTKIGPDGHGISMGQRQRLLIARAVYRNPEFIFFDEATNSLDTENESKISRNLQQFCIGKTVVIVAHRLSTVKNADQIVVLKKGALAEKGTHNELVQLKGDYYNYIRNQLELGN